MRIMHNVKRPNCGNSQGVEQINQPNKGSKSMSNLAQPMVHINDQAVQVIGYQNLPVVTTAMLAEFYGTQPKNLTDNFSNNSERFVEGKHFFKLEGTELKSFKDYTDNFGVVPKNAKHAIVWTERGAARHAKMLDTEQAWEVFEKLEEGYFKPQVKPIDPMVALNDPNMMRGLLLTYTEKVIVLQAENDSMKTDVAALDRIAKADGSTCVTDAAKALQMQPKSLFTWLSSHGWIYRRAGGKGWLGYQDKIQSGYVEHKVTEVTRGDGTSKITEQVLVTPKGLAKLAKRLAEGDVA
jgi:phage antirepressor YoqD-like protein